MHWTTDEWVSVFGRVTLMVTVSSVLVAALLALLRVRSTRLRRLAWAFVLLQGWLVWQVPLVFERQAPRTSEPVASLEANPAESASTSGGTNLESPLLEPSHAADPAPVTGIPLELRPTSSSLSRDVRHRVLPSLSWTVMLFATWIAGAILALAIGTYRYASFLRRMRLTASPPIDWQREFESARSALGIIAHVQLRVSDDVGPCLVCRLRDSCVVVPRALWTDLAPQQRIAILRHELAHYVRGDLWKSITMRILAAPQWFNPFAWWAVRRFDECAEWACDEIAAGDAAGATEYSKLLLALGTAPHRQTIFLPAARRGGVSTRIRRLVSEPRRDGRAAPAIVGLVGGGLVAVNLLRIDVVAQSTTATDRDSSQAAIRTTTRMPWHPDELVAVLGEEQGSLWSVTRQLVVTRDGRQVIANAGPAGLFIYDTETLSLIETLGKRDSRLASIALSRDGTRLIAGYADGMMTLWNIEGNDPELVQSVNALPGRSNDAHVWYKHALAADRVSINADRALVLWELQDDRLSEVVAFELEEDVTQVAIAPDGEQLVTRTTIRPGSPIPPERIVEIDGRGHIRFDCRLQLWDVKSGSAAELDRLTTADIQYLTYLPDGQTLIGNAQPTQLPRVLRSVKVINGELVEQPETQRDFGWSAHPVFSADGRSMVTWAARGAQIVDLSRSEWPPIATLDSWAPAFGVAFSAGGDSLFLAVRSRLERWDRRENGDYARVSLQAAHSAVVRDAMFSAGGETLLSAGGQTICEWDLDHLDTPDPLIHHIDMSPGGSHELEWWPQRNGALFQLTDSEQNRSIRLLDQSQQTIDEAFRIDFGDDYRDSAWCFDIHPDGKLLATGHWDRAIRFWNLEGDAPQMTAELSGAHNGHVCDIAFSPDGTMLASGGWRHAVKLWDTSTDPPSEGGELGQHDDIVRSVVFSPDARWLASGDELGIIRLWDLESNDLTGTTLRHPDADPSISKYVEQRTVNTLEFSADSSRLLSADGAGRVVVWSVPSGEIIKEWQFPGWVWVARWSPDETLIATGNDNGTIYLLAAPE